MVTSSTVTLQPSAPLFSVHFVCTVDGISQERNETFLLMATNLEPSTFSAEATIADTMEGVIMDSDGM